MSRARLDPRTTPALSAERVRSLWWPLSASWLLMALELPMVAAVVARLPDPTVHLAAYGSLVFPVALVIEAPIIMLLAASTALSRDRASYEKLWRFTMVSGALLTLLHAAVAFTPLYDVVARSVLGAPEAVIEPGRVGLCIMLPWTWAIAYRRFQQGVLIRFERSRAVGVGTAVRLATTCSVLASCYALGLPGIVGGTSGVTCGVLAEALFAGWCVRPLVRERLPADAPGASTLSRGEFARFYTPLALTPLITLIVQPIGVAAMGRMPNALASLAAWPAVYGLVFLLRSTGFAYNEVVVTLLGEPGSVALLRRFAWGLAAVTVGLLALLAATPLGGLWFASVSGLEGDVLALTGTALACALLMPGCAALQSLYQGALVHGRRTRAVTESVLLYLAIASACLVAGAHHARVPGLYLTLLSLTTAGLAQTLWLYWRSRALLRALAEPGDRGAAVDEEALAAS